MRLTDYQAEALALLKQKPLYAWVKRAGSCRSTSILWSQVPHDSPHAHEPLFKNDLRENQRPLLRAIKATLPTTDLGVCFQTTTIKALHKRGLVLDRFEHTGIVRIAPDGIAFDLLNRMPDDHYRRARDAKRAKEPLTIFSRKFTPRD